MIGTIKFYNEAKGFGQIVGENKNEYFFHISKVLNAPEKIHPNDKVEFVSFETSKGLNAKDIIFKVKINCHVCNWTNTDDEEKCGNPKCGFTLKYAKGYSANISDEEAKQYKKELEKAKEKFEPLGLKKDSKRGTSNILNGKIISYAEIQGEGFIRGEDALKYFFNIEDINKPLEIKIGQFVKFNSYSDDSKPTAIKIFLIQNTESKDTKLKINNETILTKYIVGYKLHIDTILTNGYVACNICYGTRICHACAGLGDRILEEDDRVNGWAFANCDSCDASCYCAYCNDDGEIYVGKEFEEYKYFVSLKFSNTENRKIYIGSWIKEEEKENNKVYFYGKKIIDKLDSLC